MSTSDSSPRSYDGWIRALLVIAVLIGIGILAWMLGVAAGRIQNILTTLVAAVLFAYMIYPPVRLLSRKMPRALAVLIVYVVVLGLIGLAIAYLAPIVTRQAIELSQTFPSTLQAV